MSRIHTSGENNNYYKIAVIIQEIIYIFDRNRVEEREMG